MKEKPPIISDDILLETTGRKYPDKTNIPLITQRVRAVAQAQRDADIEWHEEKIRLLVEEHQDAIGKRDAGWLKQKRIEIQQARPEVAREIFEEIEESSHTLSLEHSDAEEHYLDTLDVDEGDRIINKEVWQSLKDKFLKVYHDVNKRANKGLSGVVLY